MMGESESSPTTGASTILRWILAPLGATAAVGLSFLMTYLLFALIFGAEMKNKESTASDIAFPVMLVLALVTWTWAGSRIAPPQHRKIALCLFLVPIIFLALIVVVLARLGGDGGPSPAGITLAIGVLLACAAILVFAFHPRFTRAGDQRVSLGSPIVTPPRREPEPNHSRAAPEALPSDGEPRRPSLAGTVFRWVLAPVGAAATAFVVVPSVYSLGKDVIGLSGSNVLMPYMWGVIAWAWVGASIAPRRHRRLAFALFAAPVALFALFCLLTSVLALVSGQFMLGRIGFGVVSVMACGVMWKIASHRRYDVPLAERFENYVSSEYGPAQPQPSRPGSPSSPFGRRGGSF